MAFIHSQDFKPDIFVTHYCIFCEKLNKYVTLTDFG